MEKQSYIKIKGNNSQVLSITLHNILNHIDRGSELHWVLLWINAQGNLENGISILDFEKKVNISKCGVSLGWDELKELSTKLQQIFECTLVGNKLIDNAKRYSTEEEMYTKCDLVIELIDSSYWEVHSKDRSYFQNMSILPGFELVEEIR